MWDHDQNIDSPRLLPYVQNPPSSGATNLPSYCDEELVGEADEPPDDQLISCRAVSSPDGKFSKLEYPIYRHPPSKESLLTRALLTSPTLVPVDRVVPPSLERGMSASSVWSNTSGASTADLTSDAGMTSPSGANTPSSPPPPMYLSGIAGVLNGLKKPVFADTKQVEVVPDKDDVVEGLGRKRCITFACGGGSNISSQASDDSRSLMPKESVPPKKSSVLKFMCTQREQSDSPNFRSQRSLSPPPPPKPILGRETDSPAPSNGGGAVPAAMPVEAPTKAAYVERQLYDVEGSAESWTNQPIDKSRLLWVDGMLRQEKAIRRLSEAVEEEEMQEDEEEDTPVADPDDGDEDDEADEENEEVDDVDEDEDDQDDGEDDLYDGESGNESDNEEGFASDDQSDDELFFSFHPPMVARPACCRTPSPLTIYPLGGGTSPRRIRSPTPELPDSTDFVCGTFDEDKALEQAYLSCLEERKRIKHKTIPQDIDPSFPTSDSEESENEGESRRKAKVTRDDSASDSRGPRSSKTHSRSPRGRVHSPVPANPSRSRHASPAPARRGRAHSPAPTKMGRRMQFQTGHNIVRTRSLPRNPEFGRRAGRAQRTTSISGSPHKTRSTRPVVIRRGAMDIVKGLEKRRERRRFARNKDKEGSWKAGEGVERMRELGLEIFGKGKARQQAIWVLSA